MSRAARSIQVFAVYLLPLGLVLVMSPNTLLALFGIPATGEVWIRIVGMLAGFLGVYYWRAFFVWTVPVRLSVPLFFGAFVLLGLAPPVLLAFAAVDAAAALWTWAALRRD